MTQNEALSLAHLFWMHLLHCIHAINEEEEEEKKTTAKHSNAVRLLIYLPAFYLTIASAEISLCRIQCFMALKSALSHTQIARIKCTMQPSI